MPEFSLPLDPADAVSSLTADIDVAVESLSPFSSDIVPGRYSLFDIESYYVAKGLPFKDGNYGLVVQTECNVDAVGNPVPLLPSELDLEFESHWVASDNYYGDDIWSPISGNILNVLTASGSPYVVNGFRYLQKRSYVLADVMRLEDGSFFHTNDLNWGKTVGFAVVLTPRVQPNSEYVLFETNLNDVSYGSDVDGTFVGLKYNNLGQISFYAGDDVLWTSNTVYGYLTKPIIVAVNISAQDQSVRVTVVDNSKIVSTSHTINHPYSGCFYIGGSPSDAYSSCSMSVMDVALWYDLSDDTFDLYVQKLNQQYGVSL